MQKPTAPSFWVDDLPCKYVAAPRRSFSAWPMLSAMKSLPAPSGSSAVLPWYMSGASAVNPSAAKRSQTFLMWPTRPHHPWITSRPGPFPEAGVDRWAAVLPPFDANSTIVPAISSSWIARAGDRHDLHGNDTPGVGLQHGDRVARHLEHLAGPGNAVQRGEHEPGDRLVVPLGQRPVERLVELVDIGARGDPVAPVRQPLGHRRRPLVLVVNVADDLFQVVLEGHAG